MTVQGRPRKGDIYRLDRRGMLIEILITDADFHRVEFVTLGMGRRSGMGINEFALMASFVETRTARLRRACERYKVQIDE